MLAPNGKESNLNDADWNYVRSDEFKSFFGDWENDPQNASKILDCNGEPLVLYHGTRFEFIEFKNNKEGIHFGSLEQANMRNSKRIVKCFLNIRSCARRVDTIGCWHNVIKSTKRKHDGIIYLNRYEGIPLEEFESVRKRGITDYELDAMNDRSFKKLIASSSDSYIVMDKDQIRIV